MSKVIPAQIFEHCCQCPNDPLQGGKCECSILLDCPLEDLEVKPTSQLVVLPDINGEWPEAMKNPYYKGENFELLNLAYQEGVHAVYAQAKPVDIDDLAEQWLMELHGITGIDVPIAMKFSEFINEYMEGK